MARRGDNFAVTVKDDAPEWWTPKELGKHWRCSADKIKRQIKAGQIKAMPFGSTHRIHLSVILAHEAPAIHVAPPAPPPPPHRPVQSTSQFAVFQKLAREKTRKREEKLKAAGDGG
jgi:hypothetical protein